MSKDEGNTHFLHLRRLGFESHSVFRVAYVDQIIDVKYLTFDIYGPLFITGHIESKG